MRIIRLIGKKKTIKSVEDKSLGLKVKWLNLKCAKRIGIESIIRLIGIN